MPEKAKRNIWKAIFNLKLGNFVDLINKNKLKKTDAPENLKKEAVKGGNVCDKILAAIKVPPKNIATIESLRYNTILLTFFGMKLKNTILGFL